MRYARIGWLFFFLSTPAFAEPGAPNSHGTSIEAQERVPAAEQQAATTDRGTENSPVFIKLVPADVSAAEADEQRRDRGEKSATDQALVYYTAVLAVATIALALVALGQVGLFWWQLGIMKKGLADTKAAADAAGASAVAAKETVNIMRDTAKRQLRAYVQVVNLQIDDLALDKQPQITMIVKNAGQTPAHDVALVFGGHFDRPPGDPALFPPYKVMPPGPRSSLGAGVEIGIPALFPEKADRPKHNRLQGWKIDRLLARPLALSRCLWGRSEHLFPL